MNLNEQAFLFFFSYANQSAWLDVLIVFFAHYLPYVIICCFLFFLFIIRSATTRFSLFFETVVAVFLSRGIFTELIRFFYIHPRPFSALSLDPLFVHEFSSSFPSGHAAFFFALAGVVFLYNRTWGTFFLGASLLNGFARVMAGVHWPADIVGGIIISFVCVWIVRAFLLAYIQRFSNRILS